MKKRAKKSSTRKKIKQWFPRGWNEERVRAVLDHYENQTEDEAVAEDEAAYRSADQTMMSVPKDLVPAVRKLIARHKKTG